MPPPSRQEIAELKNTMRKLRRSLSLENKELQQRIVARKNSTESSSSGGRLQGNKEPSDGGHSDLEDSCSILVISDGEEVEVGEISNEAVIIVGEGTMQTNDEDNDDEVDNDLEDETDDDKVVGCLQQENNICKVRHDVDFSCPECDVPNEGTINDKSESPKQLQGICSGHEGQRDTRVLTLKKYKAMKEKLRHLRTEKRQLEEKNAILRDFNMRYKKDCDVLNRRIAETEVERKYYQFEQDKMKKEKMKLQEEKDAIKMEEKRLKKNWIKWEENHAVLVQRNVKLANKEHGMDSKLRRLNNLEEDRNSFDDAWAELRKMQEEARKQTEAMEEKQLHLEMEKRRLAKEWEKFNLVKQGLDDQATVVQKEQDLAKEQERIGGVPDQLRKEPPKSNPKQDVATWTDPCEIRQRLVSDKSVSTEDGIEDTPHRSDPKGGQLQVSGAGGLQDKTLEQDKPNHSPVLDPHSKLTKPCPTLDRHLTDTCPEPRKTSSQQDQRRVVLGKRQVCDLRDVQLQSQRRRFGRGLHPDFLEIHLSEKELLRRKIHLHEKELLRRTRLAHYRRVLWAAQYPYRGSFYEHDIRW